MELTRQQIDDLKDKVLRREIRLAPSDSDSRIVSASVSSETPVQRFFGNEVLAHDENSIDLSRLSDGKLPLLAIHNDREWPIGSAFDFRLDNSEKKWRSRLQFASTERAEEPFELYRQGVPLGVSIGYRVDWDSADYDQASDTYRFKNWTPMEVSIVPIEADHQIGIGRNLEVSAMADDTGGKTANTAVSEAAPHDYKAAFAQGERKGSKDAVHAERQRLIEIDQAFELPGVPKSDLMKALRATAAEAGWTPDQVRMEILKSLGNEDSARATVIEHSEAKDGTSPALHYQPKQAETRSIQLGKESKDKFADIAGRALEVRCGLKDQNKPEDKAFIREVVDSGYASMSMLDLAREYLDINGVRYRGLRGEEIAGKAFMTRAGHGHTTSDFTNLLNNVANKSLLMGWEELPETWRTISRIGSLPDFKVADRPGLSHFSDLDEVPDDGDIGYGSMSDYKETIQLVEYGKKFRVSRKLIVNDDLDGLSRVPRLMGRAAARKVGDKVYDTLVSNSHVGPTLNQDSVALFNAAHSNYVASGSGAAPSVTTIDTAKTAMGTQTDPSGNAILNISPRYLVVPKALETTGTVLMAAQWDPAGTTASVDRRDSPNPFQNAFEVVSEARLDSSSHGNLTTGWYLAADPSMFDTVEVAFLNGVAEPYIREEQEWDTRGVEFVVGIDCGVAFLDYRGLYFNYGA